MQLLHKLKFNQFWIIGIYYQNVEGQNVDNGLYFQIQLFVQKCVILLKDKPRTLTLLVNMKLLGQKMELTFQILFDNLHFFDNFFDISTIHACSKITDFRFNVLVFLQPIQRILKLKHLKKTKVRLTEIFCWN